MMNKNKKPKTTWDQVHLFRKYLRPYKSEVRRAAGFAVLENGFKLTVPIISGVVVDRVIQLQRFDTIAFGILVGFFAATQAGEWFMRRKFITASVIAFNAARDLTVEGLRHVIQLPLSYLKEKKIGELTRRINRGAEYMWMFVESGLFEVLPSLATGLVTFGLIAAIKWQIGIASILIFSLYAIITIRKIKPIIRYQKKINRQWERLVGDTIDRASLPLVIKSNTAEELEYRRSQENYRRLFLPQLFYTKLWARLMLWQDIVFSLTFILIFGLGTYYLSLGAITVGSLVILIGYLRIMSGAVDSLGTHYKNLREGLAAIARADAIRQIDTEPEDGTAKPLPETVRGDVSFKNIYFSYEKIDVLKNISFNVRAGQMVAVVGKSGEGKTTLLNLISRFHRPRKGIIALDGINIETIRLQDLRRQIAIVPQEVELFNDTIYNNIAYARPNANKEEVEVAAKAAYCHDFIQTFPKKYKQLVGERGVKLSTGQKQRVAIARAILRNPRILILDEATSALDSESERLVQQALEEVMRNRTTFVIAHRLSTIRKADLILVLENGRIVESGDHQELIEQGGVYRKLSELQRISV